MAFYCTCAALTWLVYSRKGGLLHAIERNKTRKVPPPDETKLHGEVL
jgi:NNP family nitrate/nitrite transporter-like MFS transporter